MVTTKEKKSNSKEGKKKKRSVNREYREKNRIKDKNSINFCDNKAFSLRKKKLGALVHSLF